MKSSKKSPTKSAKKVETFTDEERSAIKARAQELKAGRGDGESELLTKIAEMRGSDRILAERIHAIIKAAAPALEPKTWYGMPAYARDGKVVCFFRSAAKFKSRYATLGFSDQANLDEGHMWPTDFALTELSAADEARIDALVKRAVS